MSTSERPRERTILGHPIGLAYLCFAEAWERFSYYGMLALLPLYGSMQLLLHPHIDRIIGFGPFRWLIDRHSQLTPIALTTAIVGIYTAFVYATPILGGLIADRVLGRTRTVILGASLMALGHFLMAFDASFLIALACLLIGVGCFKGNIATQVGGLYAPGDLRRADAFQAFMLGIQIAVIISPLLCGWLGQDVGWHWGFGLAGIGMLIGLGVYLLGRKHLPPEPAIRRGPKTERPKLARGEWRTIMVLVALLPVLALGAVGNQQMNNAYPIWGNLNFQLHILGFQVPASWLLSLDAFISTITMAAAIMFWRWYGTKWTEPNEITKLTIGVIISAAGPLFLCAAALHPAGQRASLWWGVGFHVVNDIGFANVLPVGLALYSRASPKAIGGTMIAVYYLHLFACNYFVGWLGRFLEPLGGFDFWLMHAGIMAVAAVLLVVARAAAGRVLAPTVDPEQEEAALQPA